MRDFAYWRETLNSAKTLPALKAAGENLDRFQKQQDFLQEEPRLAAGQVAALRTLYSSRRERIASEVLHPQNRKKFS